MVHGQVVEFQSVYEESIQSRSRFDSVASLFLGPLVQVEAGQVKPRDFWSNVWGWPRRQGWLNHSGLMERPSDSS